jgi:hypothetical protein
VWQDLWRGRIVLSGPNITAEDQRVVDLAYYYQHSSVHRSTLDGSSPYGLSQLGLGAEIFWDQDMWQQAVTTASQPAAGLALARFRVRTHSAARKIALQFGYDGALFPWQSSGIDGFEAQAPDAWSGGQVEEHITPDVAVGVWESTRPSGDDDFGRHEAWPLLRDVARWVISRGQFTARGFEIRLTSGPDEWQIGVDNDSFMNMACAKSLEAALAAAGRYGLGSEAELELWQAARDTMVYPFSLGRPTTLLSSEGAPCNGPGSPGHLVCNRSNYQVGMLAYMWAHAIPGTINASVLHATWALEEKLRQIEPLCPRGKGGPWCYSNVPTTEWTPGFTVPPFIAMAAHFGDRAMALKLWKRLPVNFIYPPWGLHCQYDCRENFGGIYLTTTAAILQSILFGLTGLRPWNLNATQDPAAFQPFVSKLPAGWDSIDIGRIYLGGRAYSLHAEHGQMAKLTQLPRSQTVFDQDRR